MMERPVAGKQKCTSGPGVVPGTGGAVIAFVKAL
jgi:hypothetical protein